MGMPERTKPANTGLRKLRSVAPEAALVAELAPEPPADYRPALPHHSNATVTLDEQNQMLREWAAGADVNALEARYGVSRGYLRETMRRRFGSKEKMLEALQGMVAENAVIAQGIAQSKMHELNAAQAVFAGKLLVETYVTLDKHIESRPKTINFGELRRLGDSIRELKALVAKPVQ